MIRRLELVLIQDEQPLRIAVIPVDEGLLAEAMLDFFKLAEEYERDHKGVGAEAALRMMDKRADARRRLEERVLAGLRVILDSVEQVPS